MLQDFKSATENECSVSYLEIVTLILKGGWIDGFQHFYLQETICFIFYFHELKY